MQITPGRIVLFTITEGHAKSINAQRTAAGYSTKTGNQARAGDVYPLLVVRVWNDLGSVNGQLFLDGNDSYWITSVTPSDQYAPEAPNSDAAPGSFPAQGRWHWPPRV